MAFVVQFVGKARAKPLNDDICACMRLFCTLEIRLYICFHKARHGMDLTFAVLCRLWAGAVGHKGLDRFVNPAVVSDLHLVSLHRVVGEICHMGASTAARSILEQLLTDYLSGSSATATKLLLRVLPEIAQVLRYASQCYKLSG